MNRRANLGLVLGICLLVSVIIGAWLIHSLGGRFQSNLPSSESTQTVQSSNDKEPIVEERSSGSSDSTNSRLDQPAPIGQQNEGIDASDLDDPAQAWAALVDDGQADISQVEQFLSVASDWANQEGLAVVDQIRESLDFSAVANVVVLSILHSAVQSDPHDAFQSALSLSLHARNDALSSIVSMWAESSPVAALEALNSADIGGFREELHKSLIAAWTESDPKGLLDNLTTIPERLRRRAEHEAMLGVARVAPPDAVEFLSMLPKYDPNDDRRYDLAYEIAEHWSRIDANAALDWVSSVPFPGEDNQRSQRKLLTKVLKNLSIEDPDLALQSALNDPMGRFGHGLEPYVVSKVAQMNTEKAISMLSQVREGSTKAASYRSVGRALAEHGHFDRAVELGSDLPDEQQSNYYCAVFSRWARTDPGLLFESLDQLPSSLAKSQAAYNLLATNRGNSVFSTDEIEDLQGIIDTGGHTVTLVATAFSPANGESDEDYDERILELELNSNWDDGVDRVYEINGN